MTIEELLSILEIERQSLEKQYREYYVNATEANERIAEFVHCNGVFTTLEDLQQDVREDVYDYEYWKTKHRDAVYQHNDILTTIKIIKERVSI